MTENTGTALHDSIETASSIVAADPDRSPENLLFSRSGNSSAEIRLAAATLASRVKIRNKIPQWYENTALVYPDSLSAEQCSSQQTAACKASLFAGASRVADLTGGLGVDSYYISRVAGHVAYFERNPLLSACAEWNFAQLGAGNITVNHRASDVAEMCSSGCRFDMIYIDPARRDTNARRVFGISDCTPDLLEIGGALLGMAPVVVAKLSPMLDIKDSVSRLGNVSHVYAVSLRNECKELLFVMERGVSLAASDVPVTAVMLGRDGTDTREYTFTYAMEEAAHAFDGSSSGNSGMPDRAAWNGYWEGRGKLPEEDGLFVFEPDKAVLKAGAFRKLSADFSLVKPDRNLHLYFGKKNPSGEENGCGECRTCPFPGKAYRVEAIYPMDKKSLKIIASEYPAAEISCRNFPVSSEEMRKKLKIREGGDIHLFVVKISGRSLVIAGRIA